MNNTDIVFERDGLRERGKWPLESAHRWLLTEIAEAIETFGERIERLDLTEAKVPTPPALKHIADLKRLAALAKVPDKTPAQLKQFLALILKVNAPQGD